MSKALDFMAKQLRECADQNGDGKVDKQDVSIALHAAREKASEETRKYPMSALATVAVCSGLLVLGVVKGCGG